MVDETLADPPGRTCLFVAPTTTVNRRQVVLHIPAALLALPLLAACSESTAQAPAAADKAVRLSPDEAYRLAATGHGFVTGPLMAANTVYVFFDTTCPHCAHLWESAKPLQGKLKMVWMPVGLLRPQSLPQGASILAATDPAAAMASNEARLLARQGGIPVANDLPEAVIGQVKANTALFDKLGADSVPLLLYRNARSGQYGSVTGAMETEKLALLVGL